MAEPPAGPLRGRGGLGGFRGLGGFGAAGLGAPGGPGRRGLGRLRPMTVRARATLGASAVVAIALAIASLALLGLLDANLLHNAETDADAQATAVAQLAVAGRLDPLLPPTHGADFLQVVDARGKVLTSSQNLTGRPPVAPHRPVVPGTVRSTMDVAGLGQDHRQRVVQVTTETGGGLVTVYAGTSLRDADAADSTTAAALAVGVPLLLLTVAWVTWWVTGRALRPVESIRAEVAAISDRDLHRRVPVPQTHDEVARLALTMNATLDRLESSGQRQRQFIADASHELRSPIAVLRTQLEVALAVPDQALRPELISGALEDTERLQHLASDLLLLARIDAAEPCPSDRLDLSDLVQEAIGKRRGDRLPIRAELAPGVEVAGSGLWLTRVVTNLLDNAQRFADQRVALALRADPAARLAVLEVTDDGPGIPEPDRERVFERFTRLDDARSRDHGGTGLGLAIARDLAEHHRGTLTAEPAAHGARLVARLPLTGPAPEPAPRAC
ncbi:HAMP domain-containing histidine kinase [Kitasatospora sp. NBC_01287]|uniref:sensor histidine kinase n=1 Tax=Kitasatospora sp. NBC_01287 TaxID=2903573 RepID=UPI002255EA96|nr:ATP-binding protein [Kitasatospora sp. NBC_01287]MCX4745494.1 HAMP domain-containing histidine kinase [Kitasatospora sp. NBC_01287]